MFEVTGTKSKPTQRSFLAGRTAGEAVVNERRELAELLAKHGRVYALCAIRGSRSGTFNDYMMMRGAMLAGGLHRLRRRDGREAARFADGEICP